MEFNLGDYLSKVEAKIHELEPCRIIGKIPEIKSIPAILMGDDIVSYYGNLGVISGRAKSGKSHLSIGILSALAHRTRLAYNFEIRSDPNSKVLHIDTESHKTVYYSMLRKAFGTEIPENIHTYYAREASPNETYKLILERSEKERYKWIIIDGGADLLENGVNDEMDCRKFCRNLMKLSSQLECVVLVVIHNNQKATSGGGIRGHLGSELERKSDFVIECSKEKDGTYTVTVPICRNSGAEFKTILSWDNTFKCFVVDNPITEKPRTNKNLDNFTEIAPF